MAARRPFWSLPRQLGCALLLVLLQVVPAARDEAKLKGRLSKCGVAGNPPPAFPSLLSFLFLHLSSPPSCPPYTNCIHSREPGDCEPSPGHPAAGQ